MSSSVQDELEQRSAPAMERISSLHFDDPEVEVMFRYAVEGGRRLRPALVVLGTELVGGDPAQVIDAAAAVELLHKFTLIHDDIIDEDEYRRGRRTFHAEFGADRGIIMGDLLIARAQELLYGLEGLQPAEVVLRCTRILARTLRALCEGELQDCLTEDKPHISLDAYAAMIAGKTSSLMQGALELGALLGGGSEELVQRAGKCGRALGQAFQMRNDLNDILDEAVNHGRRRGAEILRKKKTCLVVMLRELGTRDDIALLEETLTEPVDEERAESLSEQLFAAFERSGALDACRKLIRQQVDELRQGLASFTDGPARALLLALGDYIEQDQYWRNETGTFPVVRLRAQFAALIERARPFYDNNRSAHDWAHIERVLATARAIADTVPNVDRDVLDAMVVLHDLVRYEDHREADSVDETLQHAERLLAELGFSAAFAAQVRHGILSHSIHGRERTAPASLEAQILFDADKLDGTGMIGAARWLMVASNKNVPIAAAADRYLATIARETSRPSPLYTDAGNAMLEARLSRGVGFFEGLLRELHAQPAVSPARQERAN